MPLFVEKAKDKHGYRFYDAAIIEGSIQGDDIIVIAPPGFVAHNRAVNKNEFQQVSEEAGPARMPKISEHQGDCNAWRDSVIQKYSVK